MAFRFETNAKHCLTRMTISIMNMITSMRVTEAPINPAAALVSGMINQLKAKPGNRENIVTAKVL